MNDFAGHLRSTVRVTLFFLSFCLVGWALLPAHRFWIGGLLIGVLVSLINGLYLAYKVNRIGQAASARANKRVTLGYLSRGFLAVLGAMLAERLGLSLVATVAGLFFFQLATLLLGMSSLRKS